MNTREQNISFFSELITCNYDLYIWECSSDMTLLKTNCPNQEFFFMGIEKQELFQYLTTSSATPKMPIVFTNSINMTWIAVFDDAEYNNSHIFLLGPAFTTDGAIHNIDRHLDKYHLSLKMKQEFLILMKSIPVLAITQLIQYGIMLHYCINQKKITSSNIVYFENSMHTSKKRNDDSLDFSPRSNHINYLYELRLLNAVETGNIKYISENSHTSFSGVVGKMSVGDSLRQAKNMLITLTVLCCRAAIKGGLPPEIAYTLSDRYIQNIELCTKQSELYALSHPITNDYIQRVHQYKTQNISFFSKMCCDYITLYIETNFSLQDLAQHTGYSIEYMCKKFKKEMGIGIKEYIQKARIDYAKILLTSTPHSIANISDSMHFCSASYFTKIFHETTGITPQEYRLQYQKGPKAQE